MRIKHKLILVVLVFCGLLSTKLSSAEKKAELRKKWEYKVISVHRVFEDVFKKKYAELSQTERDSRLEKYLNRLGASGWEMVTVTTGGYYYLKREPNGNTKETDNKRMKQPNGR